MGVKISRMDHAGIQFKTHYENDFKCSGPDTSSNRTVIINTGWGAPKLSSIKKKASWIDGNSARAYRR